MKKVGIILGIIACLCFLIGMYYFESRALCRSEEAVIKTERYLMELHGFIFTIARMNCELSEILYRNLITKDFENRKFDKKLSEVFLKLTKEKARLDKSLLYLQAYSSDKQWKWNRWWIMKSKKERHLANQVAVNFYRSGLEFFKCQVCDLIRWLERYREPASHTLIVAMK